MADRIRGLLSRATRRWEFTKVENWAESSAGTGGKAAPVPLPAGGDAFCVTGLGRCLRGLVTSSCDVETSRRSHDLVAQQGVV